MILASFLASFSLTLPLAAFGVSIISACATVWSHYNAAKRGELHDANDEIAGLKNDARECAEELTKCQTHREQLISENAVMARKIALRENGPTTTT